MTTEQKNMLLSEMHAPNDVKTITVTNKEEHQYLGNYISNAVIGNKAISSSSRNIWTSWLRIKSSNQKYQLGNKRNVY